MVGRGKPTGVVSSVTSFHQYVPCGEFTADQSPFETSPPSFTCNEELSFLAVGGGARARDDMLRKRIAVGCFARNKHRAICCSLFVIVISDLLEREARRAFAKHAGQLGEEAELGMTEENEDKVAGV